MAFAIATPLSLFLEYRKNRFPCLYGGIIRQKMQFVNQQIAFWRFAQVLLPRLPMLLAFLTCGRGEVCHCDDFSGKIIDRGLRREYNDPE